MGGPGFDKNEAPRCRRRRQNFAAKRLAAPRRRISGRDRSCGESRAATRPPSSRAAAPARQRLGRGHGAPDREGGLSGDRDDERRHRLLARLPGRRADPARRNARGGRTDLPGGLGSGHGRPRSGYGDSAEAVAQAAARALDAGAVGLNLEDGTGRMEEPLFDLGRQVEKIRAIREAGRRRGVAIVVNARTDVYLDRVGPESRPPPGDDPARRGVPRRRRRLRLRARREGGRAHRRDRPAPRLPGQRPRGPGRSIHRRAREARRGARVARIRRDARRAHPRRTDRRGAADEAERIRPSTGPSRTRASTS